MTVALDHPPPSPDDLIEAGPAEPPRRRRWFRWAPTLVALAMIVAGVAIDAEAIVAIPALFLLVVPFEKLFPRHDQRVRRPGLGLDMAYALVQPLLAPVGVFAIAVIGAASLAWLPGLAMRPLVSALPGGWNLVAGFLLFELAIYWAHRWGHEVGFLWRFHSIHHSSQRMDWISGIRLHPFDGVIIGIPFFFIIGAGFPTEFAGILAVVQFVVGLFLHANVRWRFRPLAPVVATPEFHHWHHANEREAIHSNYSALLPIWDIVFGTYWMPRDRRPMRYGVDEPIPTTLVGQLRHPLRGLPNPLRGLLHPIRAVRHLWRSTRTLLGQVWRSTRRPTRDAVDVTLPDDLPAVVPQVPSPPGAWTRWRGRRRSGSIETVVPPS